MSRRYLDLTPDDRLLLARLGEAVEKQLDRILPEVVAALQDVEELQGIIPPGDLAAQLRPGLDAYVTALRTGDIERYLQRLSDRIRQGIVVEAPYQALKIAVMAFEDVILHLVPEVNPSFADHLAAYTPFLKFNHILMMAAANAYLEAKEETIHAQQAAMLALSTPVVEVWQSILALPLVGTIDTARAKQITQNLLRSIRETQARVIILDITGVPLVDTRVANHLIKTIRAARLLGARGMIAGISPEVADTLITLDVDFEGIDTYFSLRHALEAAINVVGYSVAPREASR